MKQDNPNPSHRHRPALDLAAPAQSLPMTAIDLPMASDAWQSDVSSLRSPTALAGIGSLTTGAALAEGQDSPWASAMLFGAENPTGSTASPFDNPSQTNPLFDGPLNPWGDLQGDSEATASDGWQSQSDAIERSRSSMSALDAPAVDLPPVDRRRKLPFDSGDRAQSLDSVWPNAGPRDNAGAAAAHDFLLRSATGRTVGQQFDEAGNAAATASAQEFDSLALNVDEPTNDRPLLPATAPASQGRRRESPQHEFERPVLGLNEPSTPPGFEEMGGGMGRLAGPNQAPGAFDRLVDDSQPTATAQPRGARQSGLSSLMVHEAPGAEQPHPLARQMAMDDLPELAGRTPDHFDRDRRSQGFADSDAPRTRQQEPSSSPQAESSLNGSSSPGTALPPGLAELLRNNGGQGDQQRKNDERHAELKRQQERSNEMLEQLSKESGGGARF